MKRVTKFMFSAIALVLAACESDGRSTTVEPSPSSAALPAETVIGEEYIEAEGTIQAIDTKARIVTLRMMDGRTESIKAPADIDLTKLKEGDGVILGAYQRLSVTTLPAGSAPLGTTQEAAGARAAPGETPGRALVLLTSTVTEITAIDTTNNTVTLRTAEGTTRTLAVKNPDNQRKLRALKIGDMVRIDLLEAVAASLAPKE